MAATMENEKARENDEIIPSNTLLHVFDDVQLDCVVPKLKRETCENCGRPARVCWCPFLPETPVNIATTVYILQHPNEFKRPLSTTPILPLSIEKGKCHIIRGKKYKPNCKTDIYNVLQDPNTVLLYPSNNAIDIADLPASDEPYNLVVLDGTWRQARSIYSQNEILKKIKAVKLSFTTKSEYVIRTQPNDDCLSTIESTAIALSYLEGKESLRETLIQPLRALCQFQLNHGAVKHQSKAWLIENGLYKGQYKGKDGPKIWHPAGRKTLHCDNVSENS